VDPDEPVLAGLGVVEEPFDEGSALGAGALSDDELSDDEPSEVELSEDELAPLSFAADVRVDEVRLSVR
jgi:hypothetical protein